MQNQAIPISVHRVPDDGIAVGIVLPRRPAEVCVKAALAELGGLERERHIGLSGQPSDAQPARADIDVVGPDAIVRLDTPRLHAVGTDFDPRLDRQGPDFSDKAFFECAADYADRAHDVSPATAGHSRAERQAAAPAARPHRQAAAKRRMGEAHCGRAAPWQDEGRDGCSERKRRDQRDKQNGARLTKCRTGASYEEFFLDEDELFWVAQRR